MSAITTVVATLAATAGAVALYRFVDRHTKELKEALAANNHKEKGAAGKVIDYEQDPVSGEFRPKN